jgi:hypothetical protein
VFLVDHKLNTAVSSLRSAVLVSFLLLRLLLLLLLLLLLDVVLRVSGPSPRWKVDLRLHEVGTCWQTSH